MRTLCAKCGVRVNSSKFKQADGYLICRSCAGPLRAFLSDRFVRANIGTRFFSAALAAPFMLVLAPVLVLALLTRYVLTGRRPDDFGPPKQKSDPEADGIRAALRGSTIH